MKNNMKTNMSNKFPSWQFKVLTVAVVTGMLGSAAYASLERHGDLEIYKGPQEALPVITLMLDLSGSMDTVDAPSNCAYRVSGRYSYYYEDNDYGYTTYYCKVGNKKYFRRIDNLKMGVSDLVKDPDLQGIVKLGIGTYPLPSGSNKSNGHIDIPAKKLDATHKSDIDTFVATLSANGGTPAAQAYAEAGAYMMGTTTNSITTTPFFLFKDTFKNYRDTGSDNTSTGDQKCIAWENVNVSSLSPSNNFIKCTNWQNVSKLNPNSLDSDNHEVYETYRVQDGWDGWYRRYLYTDFYRKIIAANDPLITSNNIIPYPLIDTTVTNYAYSGFPYSPDNTKTSNKRYYEKPVPESDATCAGNGIYFLTDGEPNASGATIAKTVMNNALKPVGSSTGALSVTCSASGESGWDCMSDFADKLLNTANPSGIAIKTATVGFGSVYNSIQNATTSVDCNAGTSTNAQNLCNLGIKGQGGFYYAESAEDIVNSVKSLTGRLTTDIPPISTGSMAVPLDDLNVSTSRKFAYLPILDPDPLSPKKLWRGNLKKYNVKNGTLVDKDNKAVFTGKDGVFALNTSDLYNTIINTSRADTRRPDMGKPQVGGTYQHIFENSNSRKLYVNQGGTLKNISTNAITATAKPVGFNALTSYTNPQKQQLLNFLGFPVANALNVNDSTAVGVAFDPNKKQLGGVLHSLPQLLSKKAELKADGSIDNTKREDYVLYGSLDGALHLIKDSNYGSNAAGEEVFTFIPKHVLEQQGASFVDPDRVSTTHPIFGVDGPWTVFNNYKYTDTAITALQSLAFGGLRMGGSMYYGLNLTDISSPKMIYSVGSTYAIDGSANAKGVKNDTVADATTNTNDQKAYARMGLSFAKPSVGYVMKGGKRVMVNFLAGGYDRCYEDPKFQLGTAITTNTVPDCNGKTKAQGNGLYMVQVGQEQVDSTSATNPDASNESSFDTTIGNGNLLWWTSSDNNGAGNANFTKVTDMNHSIVTEVRVLDRNYDGLTDQVVFADLGGRVWRVDINSAEDANNFKVERVAKILDLSASGTNAAFAGTDALPRIYEKPLVTFTRIGKNPGIVGLLTVGTGDRSSPVRAQREVADRIYTFIDRDIARSDLFCYDVQDTPDNECADVTTTLKQATAVTPANLVPLTTDASGQFSNDATIKTQMDAYTKLGWYMPLTVWSETSGTGTQTITTNNRGLKMFNQPDAIAGLLFTTVYNPNVGDTSGTCSAGVTGRTQREQLCLPYGVCLSKAVTGDWTVRKTRYLSNAGIGIVDNIISDGNFDGDTKNSVVVLENFCPGGDCSTGKVELKVNPLTEGVNCSGTNCKVVTDSQIDPMQWKER